MKELDPFILLAVFQEMLGPLLWPLVALVVLTAVAFVTLLVSERGVRSRRMLLAQAIGLLGGVFALWVMATVSSSGFTDAGGPADWVLIALVCVLGAAGTAILVYTVAGWVGHGRCPLCAVLRPKS